MTWSIDTDDFRGKCGGVTYPLLRTINHALYEQEQGIAAAPDVSRPASVFTILAITLAILRL